MFGINPETASMEQMMSQLNSMLPGLNVPTGSPLSPEEEKKLFTGIQGGLLPADVDIGGSNMLGTQIVTFLQQVNPLFVAHGKKLALTASPVQKWIQYALGHKNKEIRYRRIQWVCDHFKLLAKQVGIFLYNLKTKEHECKEENVYIQRFWDNAWKPEGEIGRHFFPTIRDLVHALSTTNLEKDNEEPMIPEALLQMEMELPFHQLIHALSPEQKDTLNGALHQLCKQIIMTTSMQLSNLLPLTDQLTDTFTKNLVSTIKEGKVQNIGELLVLCTSSIMQNPTVQSLLQGNMELPGEAELKEYLTGLRVKEQPPVNLVVTSEEQQRIIDDALAEWGTM